MSVSATLRLRHVGARELSPRLVEYVRERRAFLVEPSLERSCRHRHSLRQATEPRRLAPSSSSTIRRARGRPPVPFGTGWSASCRRALGACAGARTIPSQLGRSHFERATRPLRRRAEANGTPETRGARSTTPARRTRIDLLERPLEPARLATVQDRHGECVLGVQAREAGNHRMCQRHPHGVRADGDVPAERRVDQREVAGHREQALPDRRGTRREEVDHPYAPNGAATATRRPRPGSRESTRAAPHTSATVCNGSRPLGSSICDRATSAAVRGLRRRGAHRRAGRDHRTAARRRGGRVASGRM